MDKVFTISDLLSLYHSISEWLTLPMDSCPDTGCHRKKPDFIFFTPSLQEFTDIVEMILNLLFTRLNRPNSQSLSSNPSIIFMALCWTLPDTPMSHLCPNASPMSHCGAQNWTNPQVGSLVLSREEGSIPLT